MMARNRENRYRDPGDLIIDLKALAEGSRPIIAEQKADTLAKLAEGDESHDDDEYLRRGPGRLLPRPNRSSWPRSSTPGTTSSPSWRSCSASPLSPTSS